MKFFLFGIGVGAAVGLIVAPRAGQQTRADLARRMWGSRENSQTRQTGPDLSDENRERNIVAEALPDSDAVAELMNTAKRDELMEVPGIGRATAKRIIKNRPYQAEEEILEKGVMPEKTLERAKEQLLNGDQDQDQDLDRDRDVA